MQRTHPLTSFSDEDLLRRLSDLLGRSRSDEADLVAHIGEVDRRRLYAREASPSMFAYCTEVLHLSEAEAYLRIAAARAAREHPLLLTLLADGRLHLTAIAKLAPHLTLENREALLERAAHRSKREIEELLAELAPRPDAPAVMRKLPDRRAGTTSPALPIGPDAQVLSLGRRPEGGASVDRQLRPDGVDAREPELRSDGVAAAGDERLPPAAAVRPASPRARCTEVEPLAPGRYRVQFTASAELHDKLERLRALMRSSVPDGDLGAIVEQAVTEKLQRLEARRFARTQAPRKTLPQSETSPTTRQIPAAVKRAVYVRDGGRCRYEDTQGRRCTARQGLEFHHRRPFGHGGDHSVENVALACRCHNGYLAEVDYGREAIARHRRSGTRPLELTPSPSP
ncbi:MAG TPA: HNH endonuclease signature motif containing protein [Vicinamibacteria bacterium]|nr:HNH endonuclease signature motif containing protein [Vicinamibacteria bacterium]